ncbi:hypothetical protein HYH02_004354 [Chlamydomonas schloesseri]|uniref:G8 domain-containing protein n=1 Tax=Chlamydomonas schloesseri TaxID=2026947 RepID=A0A836B8Q9_9CHLO|nr:hypothetical protein HYH02_004354 [Chlamydomonas schloesseri]|eukprot:KAG2451086.1 hypothetical protein HYH02_004354 [Chlamydomonas schloesseri]
MLSANTGSHFRRIVVPEGSKLVIDDAPLNLTLTSLLVYGTLSMGSPTCRLRSAISITFAPAAGVATDQMMALRGMNGSTVDIHGELFSPTWTRLAQTATPGTSTVTLQQPVNWRPGQLVAVPTSLWKDECRNQNEVRQIANVSTDGRNITFTTPLQFMHYAGPEYQTEVVLLSRSILLQGSNETAANLTGGHLRIESKTGRIRGVLGYRMGQQFQMGSYPFHFHMAGEVPPDSYMTDNSVYASYWRAFTIHGTHALTVANNTAFHVAGSAFYTEDGIEERNRITGNFAGYVHPLGRVDTCAINGSLYSAPVIRSSATLLQPADWGAAGFHVSNAYNVIENNAASGGVSGFMLLNQPLPIGLNRDVLLEPFKRPPLSFRGNTAHSSGYQLSGGAAIYCGGDLRYDPADNGTLVYKIARTVFDPRQVINPRDPNNATQRVKFELRDSRIWLGGGSLLSYGDRLLVDGLASYDSTMGALVRGNPNELYNALLHINTPHGSWLTSNIPGDLGTNYRYGLQFYDNFYRHLLANVTIRDVVANTVQAAILSTVFSDQTKPAHTASMKNINLVNVPRSQVLSNAQVNTGAWRFYNLLDVDGSFTGTRRPTLVASYSATNSTGACDSTALVPCTSPFAWWMTDPDACTISTPNMDATANVISCDWHPWRTVARLGLKIPSYTLSLQQSNLLPSPVNNVNIYDAGVVTQFGLTGANRRAMVITRLEGVTGLTGRGGWYVHWRLGAPKTIQVWAETVPRGTSILYASRYPPGTTFNVTRNAQNNLVPDAQLLQASSLAGMLASDSGDYYYFDGRLLFFKVVDTWELPYPGREPARGVGAGAGLMVPGARTRLYLQVDASMPNCSTSPYPSQNGQDFSGQFCAMNGTVDDYLPPAITAPYNEWTIPYCADVAPHPSLCFFMGVAAADCTCAALQQQGNCPALGLGGAWLAATGDANLAANVAKTQGYCSVSCSRCTDGDERCNNIPVMPLSVSNNRTCAEMAPLGLCYRLAPLGYCLDTCGVCSGAGLPCVDLPASASFASALAATPFALASLAAPSTPALA